jgi:flavin-binding protein dodecin
VSVNAFNRRRQTAKKASASSESSVYRITEVIGTSPASWEDAARSAVETAAKTLLDLRVAEVGKLDMKVEDGKVVAFRARVQPKSGSYPVA